MNSNSVSVMPNNTGSEVRFCFVFVVDVNVVPAVFDNSDPVDGSNIENGWIFWVSAAFVASFCRALIIFEDVDAVFETDRSAASDCSDSAFRTAHVRGTSSASTRLHQQCQQDGSILKRLSTFWFCAVFVCWHHPYRCLPHLLPKHFF